MGYFNDGDSMPPYAILAIPASLIVLLAFYVVHRNKPGRFRFTAKVLKLLDISIEVDAQDEPKELPRHGNPPRP